MDTGDLTSEIVCSLDGVNTETDYNGDRNDMLERDIQLDQELSALDCSGSISDIDCADDHVNSDSDGDGHNDKYRANLVNGNSHRHHHENHLMANGVNHKISEMNKDSDKDDQSDVLSIDDHVLNYQEVIRMRDNEIQSLQKEIELLRLSQAKSSLPIINDLRVEFNRSLDNLQTLREENARLRRENAEVREENRSLHEQTKAGREEIAELKRKLKEQESMSEARNYVKLMDKMKDMYQTEYEKELVKAKETIEENTRRAAERSFKERLANCVTLYSLQLETYVTDDVSATLIHDKEIEEALAPLQIMMKNYLMNIKDEQRGLERERGRLEAQCDRMDEARMNLEQALHATRSVASTPNSSTSVLSDVRDELDKVNREVTKWKEKVDKYKRHYLKLVAKHELELESLKSSYSEKLAQIELDHRRRENQFSDPTSCICSQKKSRVWFPDNQKGIG